MLCLCETRNSCTTALQQESFTTETQRHEEGSKEGTLVAFFSVCLCLCVSVVSLLYHSPRQNGGGLPDQAVWPVPQRAAMLPCQ